MTMLYGLKLDGWRAAVSGRSATYWEVEIGNLLLYALLMLDNN